MQNVKVLNFVEAMNLAKILKPLIPKNLDMSMRYLDLLKLILSGISPADYYKCISMLTNERVETFTGDELLDLFSTGLEKNKVIALVTFHADMLGGKNG